GMGGPISGWEMKHSTHIKNANTYAEGSRWAAGSAFPNCGAIYDDWDDDGDNELVIYNNRVCAVFEHIGGRGHYIFAKGGATGWEGSIAGNCNAYWEGTEGDYNDANHIAPLSDVAVGSHDYEHNLYTSNVDYSTTDSAQITLRSYLLKKTIKVKNGLPYLQVQYDTGPDNTYIKSGFTPDMVDVIWNADMNRLWSAGYCGYYNPNTHASAAVVFGGGGASHSTDFQSTILKGDEVTGSGGFGFYIYAGELSDVSGITSPTLTMLAAGLTDIYPPRAYYASYHPGTDVMEISFGDLVQFDAIAMANIGVDRNGDGTSEVSLDSACTVINTANARHIRIHLSTAKATAIEALSMTDPHLHLLANAFMDVSDNGNLTQTATIGDAVIFNVLPNTSITIDGFIDTTEWVAAMRVLDDPDTDSEWGLSNEIYDLNLFWDATYLYLGLHGDKESDSRFTNAWLIYLDTDPGGPNGASDLTEIDNWDRNAQFSTDFKADIQYGSWGSADGDVWHIASATTSTQIIEGVIVNTDLTADRPGSEVAISWDALYGLGEGIVPNGAQIAMCASFAGTGDDDDLGGDCVPNQLTAIFPELDNFHAQLIDGDGDGIPDDFDDIVLIDEKCVLPDNFAISAYPNPFNSAVTITVDCRGLINQTPTVEIFDIAGRRVAKLPRLASQAKGNSPLFKEGWPKAGVFLSGNADLAPTMHEYIWQPSPAIGSGIYLMRARFSPSTGSGNSAQRPEGKTAVKRVIYLK
ncbi:MAG: hypothetical protein KAG97_00270, partial [Victivallales bacterium]|nr:hypothetical protein [Victivallales bacterium]